MKNTTDRIMQVADSLASSYVTTKGRHRVWSADLTAIAKLSKWFDVGDLLDIPEDVAPGNHTILIDRETEEAVVRQAIYKLGNPEVYYTSQSVSILVESVPNAGALAGLLIGNSLPAECWVRQRSEGLNLEEALRIAEIVLSRCDDEVTKAIELDNLRERCGNPKRWDKLMDSLEKKLRKELQNRGLADSSKKEKIKFEIQRLIAEEDPINQELIRQDLYKLGCSNQSINKLVTQFSQANSTRKAKRFKPQEFLEFVPQGLGWVFPGLLPSAGVTILGGTAGHGKSTLAYDAAASVIFGDPFLGEQPAKTGKVLILVSDEPSEFVQDKLISRGFYARMDGWELIYDWDITQWKDLEEALEDIRPALVIIDSFASIHRNQLIDENASASAATLFNLNSLFERYNTAGLMIHHTNKNKEQKGVNKLRGSSSLAAAASGVWIVEGEGSVKKFTTPKLRGGAIPVDYEITLDIETGRFNVLKGNEQLQACKPVMQRVRELFESLGSDRRIEMDEVQRNVGGSRDSLYQAVSRLCNQGVLVKAPSKKDPRRKVYYLSPKYINFTPSPLPDPLSLSDILAEKHTVSSLDISDKIPDKISDNIENISDNSINLEVCQIYQPHVQQEIQEICLTGVEVDEGGEVVKHPEQVTQNTGTDKPAFKIGDRVAASDPYEVKHNWHGVVKSVSDDEVVVYWFEREGKPGCPSESHEPSYLRLL